MQPYFDAYSELFVALALFDLTLYEQTKITLQALLPRPAGGGVVTFNELNLPEYPGETVAMIEELGIRQFELFRSMILPDRSYMIID